MIQERPSNWCGASLASLSMAGHFLYKIKDVLADLSYLNWVQRTEEEMEREISNQGVCVGHSQAYAARFLSRWVS